MRTPVVLAAAAAVVFVGVAVVAAGPEIDPSSEAVCQITDELTGAAKLVTCYDAATTTTTAPPTTTVPPTTTTTVAPTTTTTVPPTTTTQPPTTTTVPPTTTTVPPTTTTVPPTTTVPASGDFVAAFDTPEDFYDRFDFGFSGQDPASNKNGDRLVRWYGDHDESCGGPTTLRTIDIDRSVPDWDLFGGTWEDFAPFIYWCAPAGPGSGHIMTSLVTVGYTIGWFTPKQTFTNVSRVCWDMNLTLMSTRQWVQVLLVGEADAARYPSARGSGGYDLGYTNPNFRVGNGNPSTGVEPAGGDLAGWELAQGGFWRYFQNESEWTTQGWNGSWGQNLGADKATRVTHCVVDNGDGTITFDQEGLQNVTVPGSFPDGPVKVVFQDDNYNGPKGDHYNPDANTWHWDNIVIETG